MLGDKKVVSKYSQLLITSLTGLMLYGCASNKAITTDEDMTTISPAVAAEANSLRTSPNNDLIVQLEQRAKPIPERKRAMPRFDVSASETPAHQFFFSLVHGTAINMVVSPDIQGNISIHLKNVTVEEALKAVRDTYGYDFISKPYGYHILPRELQSRVFPINYLNINRSGRSATTISNGQIVSNESTSTNSSGATSSSSESQVVASSDILTQSESQFWLKLETVLSTIVGTEGKRSVVVDPAAGIAVINAFPRELQQVEQYLQAAQLSLQKQVFIEAKIMEVELSRGFASGIRWDTFGQGYSGVLESSSNDVVAGQEQADFTSLVNQSTNLVGGIFSLGANFSDFNAVLRLLELQGQVNVLSSPRIATLNNQKAVIKVGSDEFFVTDISSTTTSSSSTVSDTDITLTPFFSGIALDVTPQISTEGEVTLHVHPAISEVSERTKSVVTADGTLTLPLAFSTIRETDSVVRAKDGQIVVIGGLMQESFRQEVSGIPYLRHIPVLGKFLFSQRVQSRVKSELVILLRPRIIEPETTAADIDAIEQRFLPYMPHLNDSPIAVPMDEFGGYGTSEKP